MSYTETILGMTIKIPTVDGVVNLIAGKGAPILGKPGPGDQLVEVQVDVPKELSTHERKSWLKSLQALVKAKLRGSSCTLLDHFSS